MSAKYIVTGPNGESIGEIKCLETFSPGEPTGFGIYPISSFEFEAKVSRSALKAILPSKPRRRLLKKALEAMKENGMRPRCRKCGTRMMAKNALGWVCEKCGWESEKQKRIRRELYEPTGNVLDVNDNRIVYPEYLPKYEMTPIHLSVSNELIS